MMSSAVCPEGPAPEAVIRAEKIIKAENKKDVMRFMNGLESDSRTLG
jgi:hypothetical protein